MVGVIVALHLIGWVTLAALSSHTFIEASAHTMASSPTASWFEYLELAGPVTSEPLVPNTAKSFPQDPALVSNGTRRRLINMHLNDVTQNDWRAPSMTEAS